MSSDKQPLRIETGWKVTWNTFQEVDPSQETVQELSGSSLLTLYHEHANRLIDLSWRPEYDPNGSYLLQVLNTCENFNPKTNTLEVDANWEEPHLTFESKDRSEIVSKLELLMRSLPPFEDPRILKKRGELDQPSENHRLALSANGISDDLVDQILAHGNKKIQSLLLDHPDIDLHLVSRFVENGCVKAVKNKALQKLNSLKKRPPTH